MQKGSVRLLESLIASLLLMSSIVYLSSVIKPEPLQTDMIKTVYGGFEFLDNSGDLREFTLAEDRDLVNLQLSMQPLLPSLYSYTVGYYTLEDTTPVILDANRIPADKTVYVYNYIVSGKDQTFRPTVYTVYIWTA